MWNMQSHFKVSKHLKTHAETNLSEQKGMCLNVIMQIQLASALQLGDIRHVEPTNHSYRASTLTF